MKSLFVIVSALVLLLIAAAHAYRAYFGLALMFDTYTVPVVASWVCTGVTAVLGLGLLIFARK